MAKKFNASRSYANVERESIYSTDSLGHKLVQWDIVFAAVPVWIEELSSAERELLHKIIPSVDVRVTLRKHDVKFGDKFVVGETEYFVKSVVNEIGWTECLCDKKGAV